MLMCQGFSGQHRGFSASQAEWGFAAALRDGEGV